MIFEIYRFYKLCKNTNLNDQNEYITIDTGERQLGNVKILRMFEKDVNLEVYKKSYRNLNLSFGAGSSPSKKSPSTQQQELITLEIFGICSFPFVEPREVL